MNVMMWWIVCVFGTTDSGEALVPLVLPSAATVYVAETLGEDVPTLAVTYVTAPGGTPLFEEPGERVWRLGDHAVLFLGGHGLPLPPAVTRRRSVWVVLTHDGVPLPGGPFRVQPLKHAVRLSADAEVLQKTLAAALGNLDASYLAEAANYLAGNLATLEVEATSFAVTGVGTVIDDAGNWTGNPVPPGTPQEVLDAVLTVDGAGSGLDADRLDGVEASQLVDLASNQTITGEKTFSAFASLDAGFAASGANRIGASGQPAEFEVFGDFAVRNETGRYLFVIGETSGDTSLHSAGRFRIGSDLILRTNDGFDYYNLWAKTANLEGLINFYYNDENTSRIYGYADGVAINGNTVNLSGKLLVQGLGDDTYLQLGKTLSSTVGYFPFKRGTNAVRDLDLHMGVDDNGTFTIRGNLQVTGTTSLQIADPADAAHVAAYVGLVGGEAGTYCRGRGRLQMGRAVIALPEHFRWTTAAEGLTAQVTPMDDCGGLYVVRVARDLLEVRERGDGTSDASFSYQVFGVRAGREDHQVVRPATAVR